jgi:hypothetical protein
VSEPKLKAKLFVHAALRRCSIQCLSAVVAHKGDEDSGSIMVRVVLGRDQNRIFTQVRDASGRLGWMCAAGAEPMGDERADQHIARALDVDRDLWVLDVDSPSGEAPFLDPIFKS